MDMRVAVFPKVCHEGPSRTRFVHLGPFVGELAWVVWRHEFSLTRGLLTARFPKVQTDPVRSWVLVASRHPSKDAVIPLRQLPSFMSEHDISFEAGPVAHVVGVGA